MDNSHLCIVLTFSNDPIKGAKSVLQDLNMISSHQRDFLLTHLRLLNYKFFLNLSRSSEVSGRFAYAWVSGKIFFASLHEVADVRFSNQGVFLLL